MFAANYLHGDVSPNYILLVKRTLLNLAGCRIRSTEIASYTTENGIAHEFVLIDPEYTLPALGDELRRKVQTVSQ